MAKLAVRLLILSIFATPLLTISVVTPADAATTGSKHIKKKRVRVVHQNPGFTAPSANPYSNNPYEDDPDRRRANGGGGGY
jgi:hypothetical protein